MGRFCRRKSLALPDSVTVCNDFCATLGIRITISRVVLSDAKFLLTKKKITGFHIIQFPCKQRDIITTCVTAKTATWSTIINASAQKPHLHLAFSNDFAEQETHRYSPPYTFTQLITLQRTAAGIARAERDGTRAETRFRLSPKRKSPFKSEGASVQSTAGSRGVRISGSNTDKPRSEGVCEYWLPTPFASFPFASPPVRHRVPSHFNWSLSTSNLRELCGGHPRSVGSGTERAAAVQYFNRPSFSRAAMIPVGSQFPSARRHDSVANVARRHMPQ